MTQTQTTTVFSEQPEVRRNRATVHEFPYEHQRNVISEPDYGWRREIVDRLQDLIALEVGWDGYQGEPVSFENAVFALRVLESICSNHDPIPQIVPGAGGDLQIEWHTHMADIELHIIAPNNVQAWIATEETGPDGIDYHLTIDFTEVARQIRKMTERASDRATTA